MDHRFGDYQRMIHKLAWRYHRRLTALGVSTEVEDLAQEGALVFVRATQTYDATKGAKFSTYLYILLCRSFQALVDNRARRNFEACSLDEGIGDGNSTLHDIVACEAVTVEDELVVKDNREHLLGQMPQGVRGVVRALASPPPGLLEEMRRLGAFFELCGDRTTPRVNLAFVTRALMMNSGERQRITGAIRRMGKAA